MAARPSTCPGRRRAIHGTPTHFTAGSSSGTGAGVAAGLILGGIGTDTGGSIRGPAALCGIAGIKPTYGLVSRAGVAPAAFTLDHIGPMAWTAEDCALMLQALAGHDPRDPASASRPIPDYAAQLGAGIKGMRIGVIHHFHEEDHKVSDGTQRGIDAAIATFRSLGAEISEVTLSPLQDWHACGTLISLTERASAYDEWARTGLAISARACSSGCCWARWSPAWTMCRRCVGGVSCAPNCRRRWRDWMWC